MAHIGVLQSTFTFTPVWSDGTVTSITVACTMYSAPIVETMESRTVDGQTSDYGVTVTDEANRVTLGSDDFTWSVPTAHQSTTDPYVIDWKYRADRSAEKQSKLIKESTDFQNMMNTLWALQSTYHD